MKYILLLSVLFTFSISTCFSQNSLGTPLTGDYTHTQLAWVIINGTNGTYGFDISSNGKTIIHQVGLPALPGAEGLKTKSDAEKVARFIIAKVKSGDKKPSLTLEELNKLDLAK